MDTHFVLNNEEQVFKDVYFNPPVKTMAEAASLKNGERFSLSPAKINIVNWTLSLSLSLSELNV